jgi:hypothetical protein
MLISSFALASVFYPGRNPKINRRKPLRLRLWKTLFPHRHGSR